MRSLATLLAFTSLAAATPAAASGGIACSADDPRLAFDIGIGVNRGSGGFFDVRGTLDLAMADVPADLRTLALDDALLHSWLDGRELKLQFYHERAAGDFASVDLVIETAAVEEGDYRGTYRLSLYEVRTGAGADMGTWSAEGRAACAVE